MLEIKLQVEADALVAAMNRLADALTNEGWGFSGPIPAQKSFEVTMHTETPNTVVVGAANTVTHAPAPTPAPAAPVAPVASAVPAPAAPVVTPAPATPAAVPTAAPSYSLQQLINAGAAVMDSGHQAELLALMPKYGVKTLQELPPAQYPAMAADLRALGAQI